MAYSTREADLTTDHSVIVSLWTANFENDPNLANRRFAWIYRANPAGPARCWLLQIDESQTVVGVAAVFPRSFVVNGNFVCGGIGGDFSVLTEHRMLMPAMRLQRIATAESKRNGFAFLYGFPAMHSAPVLSRAGYRSIGRRIRLTKPLTVFRYLERLTGKRSLAHLMTPLADALLHFIRYLRRPAGSPGFRGLPVDDFDDRFDDLWRRVAEHRPVLGERTSAYLRWRFTRSPHREHRIWTLVDHRTGRLGGYVVYHVENGTAVIDDLLCLDTDRTLSELLRTFERACRREGVHGITIIYFGTRTIAETCRRHAYRQIEMEAEALLSIEDSSPMVNLLTNPDNWWLFTADVDI